MDIKRTKMYVRVFWFTFKRLDDNDFYLIITCATKDGKGKRYDIYLQMPFSFVGYLRKRIREGMEKQIERISKYLDENG